MSNFYELYGSSILTKDEAKDYLHNKFGYDFQGHCNDNEGDYWLYETDDFDFTIEIRDNIDLEDNLPSLEQYANYPVLIDISMANTSCHSGDEFVSDLHQNGIDLLRRSKMDGRNLIALFEDGKTQENHTN